MFLDPHGKFMFIHTPKCAGSSLHIAFKDRYRTDRNDPLPLQHHITWDNFLKQFPSTNEIFGFTFVRDPWDRVVSAFFDPALPFGGEEIDFTYFVKTTLTGMHENEPTHESIHYFPASHFIDSSIREIDFIGRQENYVEDLNRLVSQLPQLNGMGIGKHRISHRPKDKHKDLYNAETREIVRSLFKKDIERFGYEF
jgi:hypothetical protein